MSGLLHGWKTAEIDRSRCRFTFLGALHGKCEAHAIDDKIGLRRRQKDLLVLNPTFPIFEPALHNHAGTRSSTYSPSWTHLFVPLPWSISREHCVASVLNRLSTVPGTTAKYDQFQ